MPVLPLVIGQLISKNIIGFLDNPWFVFYKKNCLQNKGQHLYYTLDMHAQQMM